MITREADYSIRTILFLAACDDRRQPVSAAHLADEMDIPYRFLRKIVQELVSAGILQSERGRTGGVHLRRKPSTISLYDVVTAVDPKSLTMNRCLIKGEPCTRNGICPVHDQLCILQDQLDSSMKKITFDALAEAHLFGLKKTASEDSLSVE